MKILFAISLFFIAFSGFSQGISFFEGTTEELFNEAKKQNKPIFIDCYTTWCSPCKWLSANVFTNKAVGEFYNKNFVAYKMDMEKGEGKDFRSKYQVAAYPTLLFIYPDGSIAHRAIGAMDTLAFVNLGKQALDTSKNMGSYIKKYQNGDRSAEFLIEYAKICYSGGMSFNINEYWKTQKESDYSKLENVNLTDMYPITIQSPIFDYIITHRDEFIKSVGENRTYDKINNVLYKHVVSIEKSLEGKTVQSVILQVLRKYQLPDSQLLAMKTELNYHMNRSRNYDKVVEMLNDLKQKHPEYKFNAPELTQICENLILFHQKPETVNMIINYMKEIDSKFTNYQTVLIKGWIDYKNNTKDSEQVIADVKKYASENGVNEIQLNRLIRQFFPPKN